MLISTLINDQWHTNDQTDRHHAVPTFGRRQKVIKGSGAASAFGPFFAWCIGSFFLPVFLWLQWIQWGQITSPSFTVGDWLGQGVNSAQRLSAQSVSCRRRIACRWKCKVEKSHLLEMQSLSLRISFAEYLRRHLKTHSVEKSPFCAVCLMRTSLHAAAVQTKLVATLLARITDTDMWMEIWWNTEGSHISPQIHHISPWPEFDS